MQLKHFHIRISKEHLAEDETRVNEFMLTVKVTNTATQYVTVGATSFWSVVVFYENGNAISQNGEPKQETMPLTSAEQARYEALKKWRSDVATLDKVAVYIVAQNRELMEIARLNCSEKQQLLDVKGFGERKTEKYGDDIIAVLKAN